MAKFESNTGELVRVTGQETNGKKTTAFSEVQFFGEQIMLTVNDINKSDPQNVILDSAEALQLAGALIELADRRKQAEKNPKPLNENVIDIFTRTFQEFNKVEDEFEAWLRA